MRTVVVVRAALAIIASAALTLAGFGVPGGARASTALTPRFSCTPPTTPAYSAPVVSPVLAVPLHTGGSQIYDNNNPPDPVTLKAVNWYGAEGGDFVPAGLDRMPISQIVNRIKALGFNAVRLPWSNYLVECDPVIADATTVAANPGFSGQPALAVFDAVVNAITSAGLVVILDNHTTDPQWCCSADDGNDLWWSNAAHQSGGDYSNGQAWWLHDWRFMVRRYAANAGVIGIDLRNEPRGRSMWQSAQTSPAACPFKDSAACNWPGAATAAANLLLDAKKGGNPKLLVFVEGINFSLDLTGVFRNAIPVTGSYRRLAGHIVYSPHAYSYSSYCPAVSSQCNTGNWGPPPSDQTQFNDDLDSQWGFIAEQGTAPIWVGEFGTETPCSGWFQEMDSYLASRNFNWAYWAVNGTQEDGGAPAPTRTRSLPETYGIFNPSWTDVNHALTSVLQSLEQGTAASCTPDPALTVTSSQDATALANGLAGNGITQISNASLTAAADASGSFSGGLDTIGLTGGVVLDSGDVGAIVGSPDGTPSTDNGQPGDPTYLGPLVNDLPTYDAAELDFDFVPASAHLSLTFVFGSAEYDYWVNSAYDDVTGIFVDGQNCALLPATASSPAEPVTINTVNGPNQSNANPSNPQAFIDNDPSFVDVNKSSQEYSVALHGWTVPLTCTATVTPGITHHLKIAVADVSDSVLDSAVFIQNGSLQSS